jgi:hypothetical protein
MNSLANKKAQVTASQVWFTDSKMYVMLHDGRELGVPLEWFPKLRDCSEKERLNWRLIGNGVGIHWEDLDEDLSVAGLL